MQINKRIYIVIFLCLCTFYSYGQLDNTPFEKRIKIDTTKKEEITFNLRSLGFNKNNEYYNDINEGLTYFGYRLIPSFGWQMQNNFKVEAGIFLHKDFGNDKLRQLLPYFNILYRWDNTQLIFGNINGSIHHRQIEPMEDFERLMYDVPEHGLQVTKQTQKLFLDAWVNWENMIYLGSDFKESLSGGLVYDQEVLAKGDNSFRAHYEFKGFHIGGQIDSQPEVPLTIVFNNSIGAIWEYSINGKHIEGFKLEAHALHFKDQSLIPQLAYTQGYGYYLNGQLSTKLGDFMLSYWYGDHFYSYKGGGLYQSISRNLDSRRIEDVRQLLILRVLNEIKIGEGLNLILRFEPHIDIQNEVFEFSHALYFNVNKTIVIKKPKFN